MPRNDLNFSNKRGDTVFDTFRALLLSTIPTKLMLLDSIIYLFIHGPFFLNRTPLKVNARRYIYTAALLVLLTLTRHVLLAVTSKACLTSENDTCD